MDLSELKAKVEAARRFEHVIEEDGRRFSFTLRQPTDHEGKVAFLQAAGPGITSLAAMALADRVLLERNLVGWTELRTSDLDPDGNSDPFPWSAEAVPLVLDIKPEWAKALTDVYNQRFAEQRARKDGAAKN